MVKIKWLWMISILCCTYILTGCYDRKDVDELYLLTITALDKVDDRYEMNSAMVNFSGGKSNIKFTSHSGESLSKVNELNTANISGELSTDLLRVIIVGKPFTENSMYNLFDGINKEDINGHLALCVYDGKSSEIIEMLKQEKPKGSEKEQSTDKDKKSGDELEENINEVINIISAKPIKGYKTGDNYQKFIINNESRAKTALLPVVKQSNNNSVEISGTAIFKDFMQVGEINLDQTKELMLLRGLKTKGIIEFDEVELERETEDNHWILKNMKENEGNQKQKDLKVGGAVSVINKRKVKVEQQDGRYKFKIEINLEGDIIELKQDTNYLVGKEENIEKIQKAVESKVKEECEQFINTIKNEIGYDIVDVAKYSKIKYPNAQDDLYGKEFFNYADIEIEVNAKIKR